MGSSSPGHVVVRIWLLYEEDIAQVQVQNSGGVSLDSLARAYRRWVIKSYRDAPEGPMQMFVT